MSNSLAERVQALLKKFGDLDHPHEVDDDGQYSDYVNVGNLAVWVTAVARISSADLDVVVYDMWPARPRTILRLSAVQDDDLVESIIRQVIDHYEGKQVI